MHDIVYILKEDIDSEELRYSLRTVEANFPHRYVWFFGGCPDWAAPDRFVAFHQTGRTKWEKSTSTLRAICTTDEVTDDFWLFNDDFFIMHKLDDFPQMYHGTLADRVQEIRNDRRWSRYSKNLKVTAQMLIDAGYGTLNYAVHVPILVNKQKALEVLDKFPGCPMFRSLYGNYCNIGGVDIEDVKIYKKDQPPDDRALLSTTEDSFGDGEVGRYIRARFMKESHWEITGRR